MQEIVVGLKWFVEEAKKKNWFTGPISVHLYIFI